MEQVPPELGRLLAGTCGGGKQEWEVDGDRQLLLGNPGAAAQGIAQGVLAFPAGTESPHVEAHGDAQPGRHLALPTHQVELDATQRVTAAVPRP